MPSYSSYLRQMEVLDDDDIQFWFTTKTGVHIPVHKGESKEEATKKAIEARKKSSGNENKSPEKAESTKTGSGNQENTKSPSEGKKMTLSSIIERAKKSKADSNITVDWVINEAIKEVSKDGKFTEKDIRERQKNYNEYYDKGKPQTIETHTTGGHWEDGDYVGYKWKPERIAVQDKILNETSLKDLDKKIPPKGEKPRLVLLGGRGGSGKSKFTYTDPKKNVLGDDAYDKNKYVVIDPDEYKEMLPEYKELVDKGSKYGGLNAWEVHEESSAMKARALDIAMEVGANVVLDGTLAKYKSAKRTLDKFKERGYIIDVAFMELPREKSAVRGISRGMGLNETTKVSSGRFVPIDKMLGMTDCEENFEKLSKDADHWVLYHNEVPKGTNPEFVAKGGKNG